MPEHRSGTTALYGSYKTLLGAKRVRDKLIKKGYKAFVRKYKNKYDVRY